MDETTRRTITWVGIVALIAIIIAFAVSRKTQLDRTARQIGDGSPRQQLEATAWLVDKQKMVEALEERPRWVQERAMLAASRLGTYDALWEASATVGVTDDPTQARIRESIRKQGPVILDLLVEAIQDKDANRRGACAGPLGQLGEPAIDPLADLMDAWDQYVRDIVRDQLTAIINARRAAVTSAEGLVKTRKDWLEEYRKRVANPAKYELEEVAEAREMLPKQPARIPEAEQALGEVPTDLIVDDLLCDVLKEPPPSADQKQEAARYLRRLGTAKATVVNIKIAVIPAVIDQLLPHSNPEVRATGCELCGQMGNQAFSVNGDVLGAPLAADEAAKMVTPLLTRLQDDDAWTVRRRAAVALGRLQLVAMDGCATEPLIAALGDPRPEVKAAAAQAIGMIAAARPFDTTALKYKKAPPNKMARAAAERMAMVLRTNRQGAAPELAVGLENVGTPAIPHLIPALNHTDDEVRLLAARTIARIGTDAAVAPLARTALSDQNVGVRQTAADALRSLATPEVIPELVRALGDDDWKVYYAAKDALARLGSPAVPQLVQALSSPSTRVAYTAQQALAEIGRPAVRPLIASLSSENEQVLKWVPIALGAIGHDAVQPAAAVLDTHADPRARAAAARALGGSGQPDAFGHLEGAWDDPSPAVREAVAAALVKLGRAEATPTLVALLQDPDAGVRAVTMERLFEWYDPPALAEFAKLLTDPDSDVRRRAAILLAEHVGGQQELRAAVASATTAGEAHDVPKSDMKAISEATDALVAGPSPASQQALDGYQGSTDRGIKYAGVGGVATVARRTKTEANREWALAILEAVLDDQAPDQETESDAWLEWQQFQQTAAVAVAQARVPGILEAAVDDRTVGRNVLHESVKALGLLGTDTSVEKLIPLCRRGGEDARVAADAIGNIGRRLSEESEGRAEEAKAAAQTLIDLAGDERDPELRAELGLAVAMIGEAAVTPSIESLAAAQDDGERAFLAAIIGKLGNVAVDPYLLRARNSVRDVETADLLEQRDWLTVALYTTGDKMARDLYEALPDEEEPPQEDLEAAAAQLEALNDAM